MIEFDSHYVMTINGQATTSQVTQPVFNPATKEVIAQVPDCSEAQLETTVSTARQAFNSWSKIPFDPTFKSSGTVMLILAESALS